MPALTILASVIVGLCIYVAVCSVRGNALGKAALVVILFSFTYWYFLPAINFFWIGFELERIDATYDSMNVAYQITAMYLCVLLISVSGLFVFVIHPIQPKSKLSRPPTISAIAVGRLGVVAVLSSFGLLVWRFGTQGSDLVFQILAGEESARANMEFYNISGGIASSLDGLWEIVNVTLSCFLLCCCSTARSNFGSVRLLGWSAVFVNFIASGSRSSLIYCIVAILLALTLRPVAQRGNNAFQQMWWKRLPFLILFSIGLIAAVGSYLSRFENYEYGMLSAVAGMATSHNDMLRELGSMIGKLGRYEDIGFVDFSLTPFSFLLPRFLGFDKDIPEHLIIYNMDRMGIDIRYDPGNYFPGIIADYSMVFGYLGGAAALAAFICAVFLVVRSLTKFILVDSIAYAFWASSTALLFVAFRNIPGSFALSILILLGLSKFVISSPTVVPVRTVNGLE